MLLTAPLVLLTLLYHLPLFSSFFAHLQKDTTPSFLLNSFAKLQNLNLSFLCYFYYILPVCWDLKQQSKFHSCYLIFINCCTVNVWSRTDWSSLNQVSFTLSWLQLQHDFNLCSSISVFCLTVLLSLIINKNLFPHLLERPPLPKTKKQNHPLIRCFGMKTILINHNSQNSDSLNNFCFKGHKETLLLLSSLLTKLLSI